MNLNHCIIGGNLTRDPEIRYTPKGTAIASFSIAVNKVYRDDKGAKHEQVSFFDCEAFGATAETIGEYIHKGDPLIVQGELSQDRWEDKQTNQARSKVKIKVQRITFVPKGNKEEKSDSSFKTKSEAPPRRPQPPVDPELEPEEEDIPF